MCIYTYYNTIRPVNSLLSKSSVFNPVNNPIVVGSVPWDIYIITYIYIYNNIHHTHND